MPFRYARMGRVRRRTSIGRLAADSRNQLPSVPLQMRHRGPDSYPILVNNGASHSFTM
jgi:hypothetical protein